MNCRNKRDYGVCTFIVTAAAAAYSQLAGAQQTSDVIAEVTVTSTRRAQSAQDVPISLQTLTGEQLGRMGADSFSGYADLSPGLQLIDAGPSNTQVVMRGVTTGAVQQSQQALRETVGIYLDDTPIAVQRFNPNLNLFDLERIEVLRGPQGTLFGAGAMSGLIRMITKKPDATGLYSAGRVDLMSTDGGGTGWGTDAMLNLPLSEKAALRIVGSARQVDGYIDNTFLGKKDINDEETITGRAALRLTPTEHLTVDASVLYKQSNYGSRAATIEEAGDLKSYVPLLEPEDSEFTISSLTAELDLGRVSVTSVSSYFDNERVWLSEAGGFTDFLTGGDEIPAVIDNFSTQREFSQELRLASTGSSGVRYVLGVFYQKQDHAFGQEVTVPGIDALSGLDSRDFGGQSDQLFFSNMRFSTRQIAAFGEILWPLAERLDLTTGLRWSQWEQDSNSDFAGVFSAPNIGAFEFENDESATTPRVNLAYRIDADKMLYADVSQGFRLGGTNDPLPLPMCQADLNNVGLSTTPQGFESDNLWNYEIGAKTAWADGRLRLNLAAYQIKWRDVQFATIFDCGFNIYVNAGELDINGLETELTALVARGLTLNATASYTNSELGNDNFVLGASEGTRAPYTPELKGSVSLDYVRNLSATATGFAHVDLSYVDERVSGFDADSSRFLIFPSYTIANVRAGVEFGKWLVSLYVNNVADERAHLSGEYYPYTETAGTRKYVARPRTYGLQIGFDFN